MLLRLWLHGWHDTSLPPLLCTFLVEEQGNFYSVNRERGAVEIRGRGHAPAVVLLVKKVGSHQKVVLFFS